MDSAAKAQEEASVTLPWWRRYTRWRQTSHVEALAAERALLQLAEVDDIAIKDVRIGPGKHDYMRTLVAGQPPAVPANADSPALVVLPGYSQGTAFWFRCLRGLAAGFQLYAVDHLGTGMSGRPPFRARSREEAEDFFVSSLERWRQEQGLDRMVLLGHSLGGYLSACYAMKHPERVQHLVLVSPAGVGNQPADWEARLAKMRSGGMRSVLFRLAIGLWDWGATPGTVVRAMGPWGPRLLERYGRHRYREGYSLTEVEVERFAPYAYHILAARGSGEFALRHLLAPFAWPRLALEDRVEELKNVPVSFIYGDGDWMDIRQAEKLTKVIKASRDPAFAGDLKVLTTPNAGHYPFVDQPGIFLKQVVEACEGCLPQGAAQRVLAVAQASPFWPGPAEDEAAELADEMGRNPVEAEARVATEL